MELTHSGLLVPSGTQEAAVAAALKQHDPDLRLVPQMSDVYGTTVWKVYRYCGSERPAEFVCGWWNDKLEPLPLSMALIDMVQLHDKNMRGNPGDVDELTAKLKAQRYADARAETQEMAREFAARMDGKRYTILPRSQSLRMARDKQRRNPTPELRP